MYEDTLTDCLGGPRLSWHGKHKSSDENNTAAHLFQPHLSFPPPLSLSFLMQKRSATPGKRRDADIISWPGRGGAVMTNERIEIASLLKRKRGAKSESSLISHQGEEEKDG